MSDIRKHSVGFFNKAIKTFLGFGAWVLGAGALDAAPTNKSRIVIRLAKGCLPTSLGSCSDAKAQ